jgi:UPF0755 protein
VIRFVSILIVFALLLSGAGVFVGSQMVFSPASDDSTPIIFDVNPGDSIGKIANRLEEAQIIKSARVLRYYSKIGNKAQKVRVGEYEISKAMSTHDILEVFVSGKSISYAVTIQEGINLFEIADILAARGFVNKEEFIKLCTDPVFVETLLGERLPSLEGYLFPETYNFTKFTGTRQVIKAMVDLFLKVAAEVIPSHPGWTRHQVVTLASVIEKETGAPFERPQISSVFHNRLKKGMRLQSDPTIIYGILIETGEFLKNIRKRHLTEPTKYNTYTVNGLPFGPIANPGRESLKAVLNPDQTDYLYFVSRNDGTHYFSKTYQEHNEAVRRFQMDASQRQGKSWRDLSKKNK